MKTSRELIAYRVIIVAIILGVACWQAFNYILIMIDDPMETVYEKKDVVVSYGNYGDLEITFPSESGGEISYILRDYYFTTKIDRVERDDNGFRVYVIYDGAEESTSYIHLGNPKIRYFIDVKEKASDGL